jgi:NCS1 family nucleobase:cation symporter-1
VYGKWAWRGLVAYVIALICEVPFVSQVDYTGFLVKHLGGADISWIVGFVVAGVLYIALTKIWPYELEPTVGVTQVATNESITP